jgi:drug/metabolite transporter (DMT)-like permease
MDTYYTLGKLVVAVALVAQLMFLAIYSVALKRHRNRCFTLLFSGAVIGLSYAVIAGLPFFITLGLPGRLFVAKVTLALLIVGAVLGMWGMLLLVRSYSSLAGQVSGGFGPRA